MKNMNNSGIRRAIWMLLIIAIIVCSIPPIFAQEQTTAAVGDQTQAIQKALLKQQVLDQITVDKARFVEGLVGRWVSLTADNGVELRGSLMSLSVDKLADASLADSKDALNKIIFNTDDLGQPNVDLVFNKVTPCRIIDTRLAGGQLVTNVIRDFDSQGPFTDQGGSSTNCGLPPSSQDTAALMVILVAVDAEGVGNLRAFPEDAAVPNAVVINYNSSNNLANTVIIPLKQDALDEFEFSLRASISDTDVVADVVGYFWSPEATALDNQTLRTVISVSSNTDFVINSPSCPVGWRLTGGGVISGTFGGIASVTTVGPNNAVGINVANQFDCRGKTAIATQVFCYAICARVPGR